MMNEKQLSLSLYLIKNGRGWRRWMNYWGGGKVGVSQPASGDLSPEPRRFLPHLYYLGETLNFSYEFGISYDFNPCS